MRGDRNCRGGERAADVPLVCNVVHAAKLRGRVRTYEVCEYLRKIRHTTSGQDLDLMRGEITTDELGKRANSASIALALDEHEGTDALLRVTKHCHRRAAGVGCMWWGSGRA